MWPDPRLSSVLNLEERKSFRDSSFSQFSVFNTPTKPHNSAKPLEKSTPYSDMKSGLAEYN